MASVMAALGYSVSHKNVWWTTNADLEQEELLQIAMEATENADAFVNNPWPLLYQELDEKYPNAKFILTVRDSESWMQSARNHFSGIYRPEYKSVYGLPHFDGHEDEFLAQFEAHNAGVEEYFRDRPGKLLVVDLINGDGWEPICDFLDKPVPDMGFIHTNRAGSLRQRFQRYGIPVMTSIRSALGMTGVAKRENHRN